MIWAIVAFAFAGLGSKVLLGLAVVYGMLPEGDVCNRCDATTARLMAPAGLRSLAEKLRIQSRWCPHCGESFLARGSRPPTMWVGAPGRSAPVPAAPDRTPVTDPAEPRYAFVRRPQ